jgi:hypothetical protein
MVASAPYPQQGNHGQHGASIGDGAFHSWAHAYFLKDLQGTNLTLNIISFQKIHEDVQAADWAVSF